MPYVQATTPPPEIILILDELVKCVGNGMVDSDHFRTLFNEFVRVFKRGGCEEEIYHREGNDLMVGTIYRTFNRWLNEEIMVI
mgnify:FL=1